MMDIDRLALVALTCVVTALDAAAAGPAGTVAVGIVSTTAQGRVTVFTAEPLAPGAKVSVQYPGPSGSVRCCRVLRTDAFERITSPADAIDADSGNELVASVSNLKLAASGRRPFVGIAAVHADASVKAVSGRLLRVASAATVLTVRSCFSNEGFHVRTFAGRKRLSDWYLGLGYTVASPDCIE